MPPPGEALPTFILAKNHSLSSVDVGSTVMEMAPLSQQESDLYTDTNELLAELSYCAKLDI